MKKFFSLLTIAAVLLAPQACNKHADTPDAAGDSFSVHFRVGTGIATRANSNFGTGANVDSLCVQVFRVVGDATPTYVKTTAQPTITKVQNGEWDVDMKLAKSYKYRIAFWAHQSNNGIYTVTDLSAVAVKYSAIATNSDKADAFCAARELAVNGAITETVELYRPLAQINLGTNDLTEYVSSLVASDDTSLKVAISMTGVPSVINVIGGAATEGKVSASTSTPVDVSFPAVAALSVDDKLVVNSKNYEYLSMVYVLADKTSELTNFTAVISSATQTINTVTATSVPFQANYRTNIVGQLLCGSIHYDVVVVPGFYTPNYDVVVE